MKHNKKRNVGIIYELLLKNITSNLLEGNKKEAKITTKIIEKHFRKGTELYKEFRLFNALSKSHVSNTHVVASILNEAKAASRNLNEKKLEKEKSNLLKDINYKINDKDFYYNNIPDYRDLGLVQLTLNEWRKKDRDIKKLVDLETRLGELLLKEKSSKIDSQITMEHSDRLVLKLMTEKFNKEYGQQLSNDQKTIIEHYIFNQKNPRQLVEFFKNKKNQTLTALEEFEDRTDNKHLLSKLDNVKNKIISLNENNVNDENIVKFLTLTKLISEIKKEI
jgi:hypothetical protein|tara:strand:- start:3740 stop:4573 length:834 start_codon:yes stop_codon:yes gene_type:complete